MPEDYFKKVDCALYAAKCGYLGWIKTLTKISVVKCEKLENEVILVINGVSTIYLWRKNEEKGPILSEISVFKKNKLRKDEKRKCQQNGKNL